MMRTINVRLLLVVAGIVAFSSVGLLVTHRLQAANIRDALLWQATQAEKTGRTEQAVRHLRRYLEFAPNDLDARARLAAALADPKIMTKPSDRERARFELEQVLARDSQRHATRKALVRLALDASFADLAEEHLRILQQSLPNNAEVDVLAGRWHELKEQDQHALSRYQMAIAVNAETTEAYVRLFWLLRRLGKGQQGKYAIEANRLIKLALAQGPNDKDVLLAAAANAQDKGDFTQAQNYLERGCQRYPSETQFYQALAHVAVRAKQRDQAVRWLKKGLDVLPKSQRFELLWTLANLHIDDGRLDQAREVMQQIQTDKTPRRTLEYLEARTLMSQCRWDEAARLLEQTRLAFKVSPALTYHVDLHLGRCYERSGESARQMIAYERALEYDPTCAIAQQGYAAARSALGKRDK